MASPTIVYIGIVCSGISFVQCYALQADDAVTWFKLPSTSSADDASINELPPALRAAARIKAVTAISKEGTADHDTQGLQISTSAKAASCDGQHDKKRIKRTYSSESIDVSCLRN